MLDQGFQFTIDQGRKTIGFTINTKIYSLKAIYQAAYLFLDKVYIYLDGDPQKEIFVKFKGKNERQELKGEEDLEKIANEFYNELLNQILREKLSDSNAKIREFIVAQALYNAVPNEVEKLLHEVEEENWQEDPLGIAKTWSPSLEDKEGND